MGDSGLSADRDRDKLFQECYNQHYSNLVVYVFYLIGDFEQAEEIVQDVFVRVYRNVDALKSDQQATKYLYIACRNAIKNEYRRRSRLKSEYGKTVYIAMEKYEAFFQDSDSAEENFMRKEEQGEIISCLEKLKMEDREIILLKEFMGQKYDEIASRLQTTTTVVRGRLHKARQKLRKLLIEKFGDELNG